MTRKAHTDEALIEEALAWANERPPFRNSDRLIRLLADALAARLATITPEREAIIAEIIAAMRRTSANVVYPIEPEDGDEPDEHMDMFSGYLSPRHVGTLADSIIALTGKAETP